MRFSRYVSRTLWLGADGELFDAIASVEGGILRGQGRQHLGGIANVIVYWFIALPAGLALAFRFDWGLYGLWAGMVPPPNMYVYAVLIPAVVGVGVMCVDSRSCRFEE